MAQNVTIAGASYLGVPSIEMPKTGGGTAVFVDTSDANAAAGDITKGKIAYVDGTKITGTLEAAGGKLQTKTVTGNGIYTPDSGYDGFSQFEVAVSNLLAENIRRCANVGGVEGAYFQPEIWVFNEKITPPSTASGAAAEEFRYTGLSFLSPALFALTENFFIGNVPNLAIGHTLLIDYAKAKDDCRIKAIGETVAYMDIDVLIPAGESAAAIIKHFPTPPSGFFDKTTGWWGAPNKRYPNQIGRVIVFLKAPEGDFLTWLQANATQCQSIDRDFISRDYQNTTYPFATDPLFQLIESKAAETERGAKEITKNGKYTIFPAAPYVAMKRAAVNVNVPVPSVQDSKAVTITSNGTVSITPDTSYDALKKVDVTVDVASGGGGGAPSLQSKYVTYTENGTNTITPDAGYDGLSSVNVTVDVAGEVALPIMYTNSTKNHVSAQIQNKKYTLKAGIKTATPLDGGLQLPPSRLLDECKIVPQVGCVVAFHLTASAIIIDIHDGK